MKKQTQEWFETVPNGLKTFVEVDFTAAIPSMTIILLVPKSSEFISSILNAVGCAGVQTVSFHSVYNISISSSLPSQLLGHTLCSIRKAYYKCKIATKIFFGVKKVDFLAFWSPWFEDQFMQEHSIRWHWNIVLHALRSKWGRSFDGVTNSW